MRRSVSLFSRDVFRQKPVIGAVIEAAMAQHPTHLPVFPRGRYSDHRHANGVPPGGFPRTG
jgi:hypothetical protein